MNTIRGAMRFIGFWFAFSAAFIAASGLAFSGFASPFRAEQTPAAGALLMVVTFCYAAMFAMIASRSAGRGLRLVAAVWWAFFGIAGLLTQIESLLFLQQLIPVLTPEFILRLTLQTAVAGLLGALLAALFYGQRSAAAAAPPRAFDLRMRPAAWAAKLAVIAVAYFAIYWSFGYFVAIPLGGEAFAQFYDGLHLPAWFVPFQLARGVVWATTTIPILLLWNGPRRQAGLLVALMFPVFMGVVMILPNPIFPDRVRIAHLIELLGSNFLNGWVVYGVLTWKKAPSEVTPAAEA